MDDTARALGARGSSLTINGKPCQLRPVTLRELAEIERNCVRAYRTVYLQRLKDSIDIIGQSRLEEAAFASASWDVTNLPKKSVYDPKERHLTQKMLDWLVENTSGDSKILRDSPIKALRAIATLLDNETLTPEIFESLTGERCAKVSTGYVTWWITGSFEGMVELAFHALRDNGITREDLQAEFTSQQESLWQVAREAEALSTPDLGNGQDPSK